ncbi:twin-arginine translocase subunit TatC [Desulfovibrio piger]
MEQPAAPAPEAQADDAAPAAAEAPADPLPDTAAPAPDAVAAPAPQGGDDAGQPPVPPATAAAGTGGTPEPEEKTMGLMDHLNELRWRLVRCFIAAGVGFLLCWTVVEPIFNFITAPLLSALPAHGTAMYTTLPEPFFVRMFVAFVTGLFVTSPYIFYQIWAFISPGLYEEEKKGLLPIALLSAIFFIGGGVFCYFIVFPYAFNFFLGFSSEQIQAMPRITDYLDFVIKLLLAFGLIFEMPLFSFFLSRMGLITAQMMRKVRRYAVLCIFIVAAILTPPDVVSQLLMAMPMLLLYEISILVAAAFGRKKKEKKEEEEGTPGDPAPADPAPASPAPEGPDGTTVAAAAAAAATVAAMSDDDAQRMPPEEEETPASAMETAESSTAEAAETERTSEELPEGAEDYPAEQEGLTPDAADTATPAEQQDDPASVVEVPAADDDPATPAKDKE